MTTAEIARQIAADYAAASSYFVMFQPPTGHVWVIDPSPPTRCTGNADLPNAHDASLVLRFDPGDDHDRHQLCVEIRLVWSHEAESHGAKFDRLATLCCQTGRRFYRHDRLLVTETVGHYRAPQLTRLCSEIAADLVVAMRRYLTEAAAV